MNVRRVREVGDAALLFDVPAKLRHAVAAALREAGASGIAGGVVDVVPGECSVLVRFEPGQDLLVAAAALRDAVERVAPPLVSTARTEVVVPVRYDGPDLDEVAHLVGASPHDVVRRHLGAEYEVAFMGFAPGFGYLDGLPDSLRVPRLATPRARVEAGSVAIAEARCCIYPRPTPGGWRVIGHTELAMFDPSAVPPSPFVAGARVRFVEA